MTKSEQIKALEAQLKSLKSEIPSSRIEGLTVKIGEKGTVNIYGMGRFPVCLYFSQIQKLTGLLSSEAFADFLYANRDKLASKGE